MKLLGHVMILASAGSGKTYALTNRFVQLLAGGARPERIVALTFTRKAAGEFFDEILNKLAAAASKPARAAQLGREIGEDRLQCTDFLRMLRAVTDAMHQLSLGTFDSFFARLVRSFPLELGLGGDFEILQEPSARIERRRVLRVMFAGPGTLTDTQRSFVEAFKRATFGTEQKRLGRQLDSFLDEYQEVYLAAPAEDRWGVASRIWPQGCPWLDPGSGRAAAAQALFPALPWDAMNEKQRGRWQDFFSALEEWSPGAPLSRRVEYILKNALEVWADLQRGAAEIRIERRGQALSPSASVALVQTVRAIIGAELTRRLEMTRGIFAVLHGYEAFYHDMVRRAGKLTFADVQRLLAPDAGAPLLSSAATDREAVSAASGQRLLIDFRLDAQFDHWLLDEFQDTSFAQWSVLRNLIDEVIQDSAGQRSFFYVGDVKQAIFTWREGDPRLFREIFEHYNRGDSATIREERRDRSFRSGPAVIATVNRVFGAADVLRRMFPAPVADAWTREWRDHTSAHPELEGQTALLLAEDETDRFARTLEVLREVRPLDRGLTCAVLVRTNDTGTRLADYLRREGNLPALAESDLQVCIDNPVGAVLLALAKAAAHPGDRLAWELVRMTPLGDTLAANGLADPDTLTLQLLDDLHTRGFERTTELWLRRLEPLLAPDDTFSRERSTQFAAAARQFDETGNREVAEFIEFMENYLERETESASAVRVMTVHKAKGLGFDLVILPDLEGNRLDQRREGLAVQKGPDRSVEWILDLPSKSFCDADEVLSAHIRSAEAEACYEKLSVLYVAMTRARRAMYLIIQPPGSSSSNNFPRLLTATLGETASNAAIGSLTLPATFAEGNPSWHMKVSPPTAPAQRETEIISVEPRSPGSARRLLRQTPSQGKMATVSSATLFSVEGGRAAEFGTEVHQVLAAVEWWNPADYAAWITAQRGNGVDEQVLAEVLACLNDPKLQEVFARPKGHGEVWRERAFEVVLDGTWVTGVFDRVVIERGTDGNVQCVTVIDFKTDRLASEDEIARAVQRYAEQLILYRRAAARLAGVQLDQVTCKLLLTDARRIMPVPGFV